MKPVGSYMLLAIFAAAFSSLDAVGQDPGEKQLPERFSEAKRVAACDGKKESDDCQYSYGRTHVFSWKWEDRDFLKDRFSQGHGPFVNILKEHDISYTDWWRSAADDYWQIGFNYFVFETKQGQTVEAQDLDEFGLYLVEKHFPLEVYLTDTWKGRCGSASPNEGEDWYNDMKACADSSECDEDGSQRKKLEKYPKYKMECLSSRVSLVHPCDGDGDVMDTKACTTGSLQLLRKKLGPSSPYNFTGSCWNGDCKFKTLREFEIEACMGKEIGSRCSYGIYDELHQGFCLGSGEGQYVYCSGADETHVAACNSKKTGDKCNIYINKKYWVPGVCGYYGNAAPALSCGKFQYSTRRRSDPFMMSRILPKRQKPEETCFSKQEVQSMRGLLHKLLGKPNDVEAKSRRRRRGR